MLETVVGFVALGISIFAVAISIVFYFKSDNLYKEMLKFITEIRTYSVGMYKDTFGMLKEAWPQVWRRDEREKISQETKEEKEKIKQEITKDFMTEFNKIKEIASKGIQAEQLKKEMASLEQKFTKALEEAFGKIEALDRKKERIEPPSDDIDRRIVNFLYASRIGGFKASYLIDEGSKIFGVQRGTMAERIRALKEKGLFIYDGKTLTPSKDIEVNIRKLDEMILNIAGGKN